jgi:hypothetical protein
MNLDELRSYIPFAMAREGWHFNPTGSISPNPQNLPHSYFPAFLYETYKADVKDANRLAGRRQYAAAPFSDFARVFGMLQDHEAHAKKYACVEQLRFGGTENLAPLRDFARAVTGENDEVYVSVFAHFLSNIKRKMLSLPVTYQIMPILTGKQKGGKSTAVRRLLNPLGETLHETTITSSLRAENFTMFSQYFVVFFDEMEGIQKSSIAALKKMITEERAGGRIYYTQRNVNLPNLASFIGTGNDAAAELIDDKTGARRFFEIPCAEKLDWDAINAVDFIALWQGVDETQKSRYYLAAEKAIEARQEHLVSMDMFATFLAETHLKPPVDETTTRYVTGKALYTAYAGWLDGYKSQPLHAATFFKKLNSYGFERIRQTITDNQDRRTTVTLYRISSHSAFMASEEGVMSALNKLRAGSVK